MKRHQLLIGGAVLFMAAWAAVVFEQVPVDLTPEVRDIVTALPSYSLIAFGCYALFTIGVALFNFGDCNEASEELKEHVLEARAHAEKNKLFLSAEEKAAL